MSTMLARIGRMVGLDDKKKANDAEIEITGNSTVSLSAKHSDAKLTNEIITAGIKATTINRGNAHYNVGINLQPKLSKQPIKFIPGSQGGDGRLNNYGLWDTISGTDRTGGCIRHNFE